jgi:hypothetical protein
MLVVHVHRREPLVAEPDEVGAGRPVAVRVIGQVAGKGFAEIDATCTDGPSERDAGPNVGGDRLEGRPADVRYPDGSYPQGWFDSDLLTVAEALAVLSDVTPPYPPLPERLDPLDPPTAIATALAQLAVALDEVSSVQDLTRIGLTALVLRRGGGVVA